MKTNTTERSNGTKRDEHYFIKYREHAQSAQQRYKTKIIWMMRMCVCVRTDDGPVCVGTEE